MLISVGDVEIAANERHAKWRVKMLDNMLSLLATPSPLIPCRSVILLLGPVSPPDVAQDSTQPMTISLGRVTGWVPGDFDSTTRISPFGST